MDDLLSRLHRTTHSSDSHHEPERRPFVHELFQQQAHANPDDIAIVSKSGEMTFGELNRRANQLAWYLRSRGAGSDVLVPISVDRSADMAIGILGILKAGAAFVPIDPQYPADRVAFMIEDSAAPFVVTQSTVQATSDLDRICLDTDGAEIGKFPDHDPPRASSADDLAYVIYTSGTTGKPKGVMLTNANLSHYVHALQEEFRLADGDKYLHLASLGFSSSRRHLLLPLAWGVPVVIADEFDRLDPIRLFELIKQHNITVLDAVPSFQRHCVNTLLEVDDTARAELLDNDLRLIVSASEPLYSDIPRTWMIDFDHPAEHIHMIGQTETSGIVALGRVTREDSTGRVRAVPAGKPIANTQILLLDEDLTPVTPGESGEMYVAGAGVGRGYLGRPELSAKKFVEITGRDGITRRYCRTGDHAELDADGRLVCLGRGDFQVKIRGNRIELGEIEALLLANEGVRECVVVALPNPHGEMLLAAYFVPASAAADPVPQLKQELAASLPDYMLPSHFISLDALPLTPNGKIDRKALPAIIMDQDGTSFVGEQSLEAIWCEVLGIANVQPEDNFFSLGGHSLMASRMIARVRSRLGIDVPMRTIFDSPTFGAFSRSIALCEKRRDDISSLDRPDRIPLSFAQQRVWFLGELDNGLTAYNECEILKLEGDLDVTALRTALQRIVDRHEVLRTVFAVSDGEPYQLIRDDLKVECETVDLTGESPEQVFELARRLNDQPFDLTSGPLFQFTIARVADANYLILVLHHAVTDAWSVGVFIKDLDALYRATLESQARPLEPLAIQYAEYAIWQEEWLATDSYQRQLAYWCEQLADAPRLIEMPTDQPRPPINRYRGAQATAAMDGETAEQIKTFCEREGVTPYMLLLAAWQLLLYRYSGQDQMVVGTPIAGRNRTETEDLIGFFVNTLAIRGDLSGDPSFRELLQRTRERSLAAFENQDLPFEKLVEAINPGRDLSYTPIFQVMFALQNAPGAGDKIGDLDVERLRLEKTTAKFDLSLDVYERSDTLELQLEFNTDLYKPQTAERILEHLKSIIASVVRDPDESISKVRLLTEPERTKILEEWNSATVEVPNLCIHELFEQRAAEQPDVAAVIWKNESISYRELDVRANQLARFLIAKGAGPERLVGVHLDKSIELIVSVLGILKSGAAYLPLDPNYPSERLQLIVDDADVSIVITDAENSSSAEKLGCKNTIHIDIDRPAIDLENIEKPDIEVLPTNLAYVTFTSGSTGRAKGVMIEHRNVVNVFTGWEHEYGLRAVKNHLQMASYSFDVFSGDLTRALCSGGTLVLCPTETLLEPIQLERLINEQNTEIAEFVPSVIRPLMQHLEEKGRTLPTFKVMIVGSDTWQTAEYRRLQGLVSPECRVINSYGMTETAIDSTYYEMGYADGRGSSDIVPIGRPFPNTEIYILDQLGNPLPVGVPGELYQGGPGVGRGYLGAPELTAAKFVEAELPASVGSVKKRLYRSGDLARYRPDGTVEILGRADTQVKLRGFRIELGEIESVLSRHGAVRECVVTLRQDLPGDKRLVAYVTRSADELEPVDLRNYLKAVLPDYMVPSAFVLMDQWPLTPNGKIDRRRLPIPDSSSVAIGSDYVQPEGTTETLMADIWAGLLRVERVGRNDNFFELGGHSLIATQVVSRTRDALGCDLPLRTVFESPTIAELAERVDEITRARTEMTTAAVDEDELERLLSELETYTDEEAEFLLAANRSYLGAEEV